MGGDWALEINTFLGPEMATSEKVEREGWRCNSSQSWVENTNMIVCISSLLTLLNTCRKVPLQVKFLDDDSLLGVYIVN